MENVIEVPKLELSQLTQLVAWLDEEHRKDRIELQTLREKIAAQTMLLEKQEAQLRAQGEQIIALQNQLARLPSLDESLTSVKGQISYLKEQLAKQKEQEERAIQARKVEVEQQAKWRAGLEQRLETMAKELTNLISRLQALTEEQKRYAAAFSQIDTLRQQLATAAAKLSSIEAENRRAGERLANTEHLLDEMRLTTTRLSEERRLAGEEQRHFQEVFASQAQALNQRCDEQAAALRHLISIRSQDQEQIAGLQAQMAAILQMAEGIEVRLKHLETSGLQMEEALVRLIDKHDQLRHEQVRLAQLLEGIEQCAGEEMPAFRKLASEWDTVSRQIRDRLADLAMAQQRDRDTLNELRKAVAAQEERLNQFMKAIFQFQEQTLRTQLGVLEQRIQEAQKMIRPAISYGEDLELSKAR